MLTHADIYEKFIIEYDKANITSSYPALTSTEIKAVLDKAYLALIAQKVTGNNQRKVPFEGDIKAIEDLRPLVSTITKCRVGSNVHCENELIFDCPKDQLYYIQSVLSIGNKKQVVKTIPHEFASKFMATDSNLPWISNPICFFEGNNIYVLYDSYKFKDVSSKITMTYIKKPKSFKGDNTTTLFELSDTMAEELVNLAIVFATNNVESQRLQQQVSLLNLES